MAVALATAAHAESPPAPTAAPARLALRAARLVDGVADRARENAVVLVEGERIAAVGGDPLADLSALRRPAFVMLGGKIVRHDAAP